MSVKSKKSPTSVRGNDPQEKGSGAAGSSAEGTPRENQSIFIFSHMPSYFQSTFFVADVISRTQKP